MRTLILATITLASLSLAAPAAEPTFPQRIPSAGGEVILPTQDDMHAYETYRYAAARRAGDYTYISGVVAGPPAGQPADAAAFKEQLRRAFRQLQATLKASGADFKDVVMINSFHVWESPDFKGTKQDHFMAVEEVVEEFMDKPWPAWTAVGTTGLLGNGHALVEIQMIAYTPQRR
jgi:enamine deaminase RidA (YjgF/YER057c/UK114 family)